ncbi:hypothetical protein PF011_g25780 [Phytophthora fragariae]|uniref:Uncharacterized protein n=1 Tax=Phytophthora fragariae TaxID=53985 RepID=A0A6A3HQZ0_9STRA|nr:hypothetical protein PF003_g25561 [Phytophthora fragariae]KAE8972081.1 hypothetical protein PF011_g25780 [Phytophthora fragariae]
MAYSSKTLFHLPLDLGIAAANCLKCSRVTSSITSNSPSASPPVAGRLASADDASSNSSDACIRPTVADTTKLLSTGKSDAEL